MMTDQAYSFNIINPLHYRCSYLSCSRNSIYQQQCQQLKVANPNSHYLFVYYPYIKRLKTKVKAHKTGMKGTEKVTTEVKVREAMER